MFKNKKLLITGGTGSFGNAILKSLIHSELSEIRIFSRDEKKQDDMRKKYSNPKLKFYIGDVRDRISLVGAINNIDYIFHAAALKQVPSCEFYPLEAVKTNILGTENVLDEAINQGVKSVVVLSTDKAVYPISAMGQSKALMEKVSIAKSRTSGDTKICITRYGNVIGSRGSVIPLFREQILKGKPLTITDPLMTRFIMTLENAVDLVLFAFENGVSGDIFVQKAPAASIETVAQGLKNYLNIPEYPTEIIGTRHGEKLYEVLLSREEMFKAQDQGKYFRLSADQRDLNYELYINKGQIEISNAQEYSSHNTNILNVNEFSSILKKAFLEE